METRDYLMRQFNQLGKVLGKIIADILGHDNTINANHKLEMINKELSTSLKIGIDDVINIPLDDLISRFKDEYDADFTNFEDLAEFLYSVGYLFQDQNDLKKRNDIWERALIVYQYLQDNGDIFSFHIQNRIGELADNLST